MTTAVEKSYIFARLDELEPAPLVAPDATDDGRRRFNVRRLFDITSFGVQAYSAPSGIDVIRAHDEMLLGEAGQEELYIVLQGAATIVVVGGTPGKGYEPAPEEASEAFAAYNAGDYETALAKQRVVVEKRSRDPVAQLNAGCFAARAGHAHEAIEHLRRPVEINERVQELVATDEDLDSIREDQRFAELT